MKEVLRKRPYEPDKALLSLIGVPRPWDIVGTEAELAQSTDLERYCSLSCRLREAHFFGTIAKDRLIRPMKAGSIRSLFKEAQGAS